MMRSSDLPQFDTPDAPRCLSITGGLSSHAALPGVFSSGGEDWFESSVYVEWDDVDFPALVAWLDLAKAEAQISGGPKDLSIGSKPWPLLVTRQGKTIGGDDGTYFDFVCDCFGMSLLISKQPRPKGSMANVRVRISGRECLLTGAWKGLALVREFISEYGGKIIEEKLSRVDLCLDLAGLPVDQLLSLADQQHFICRARKRSLILDDENYQGMSFGSSPCRLIIYDKLKEQRDRPDPLRFRAMIDRRWGGNVPLCASRVEFQLGRDFLKAQGVNSPEDYERLRGSLIAYLTEEWFRLTDRPADRKNKNQQRAEIHPLWQAIQGEFRKWTGEPNGPLISLEREKVDVELLGKQAVGVVKRMVLEMGHPIASKAELWQYIAVWIAKNVNERELLDDLAAQRSRFDPASVPKEEIA